MICLLCCDSILIFFLLFSKADPNHNNKMTLRPLRCPVPFMLVLEGEVRSGRRNDVIKADAYTDTGSRAVEKEKCLSQGCACEKNITRRS